jgi:hypothetical protein
LWILLATINAYAHLPPDEARQFGKEYSTCDPTYHVETYVELFYNAYRRINLIKKSKVDKIVEQALK